MLRYYVMYVSLAASVWISNSVSAALYHINLIDNDGPHIQGIVNTTTDQLVINSWTENSGGSNHWTPGDLPRTYPAVNAAGSTFDVPDNWNGTIGNTWGFINPNGLPAVVWNEGVYFSGALAHDGWGGWIASTNNRDVSFSQLRWPVVPLAPRIASTVDFDVVSINRVPEPATALVLVLGLAAGVAYRSATFGRMDAWRVQST